MNKFVLKKVLLLMSVSVFLLSCMDNSYDIDKLNKEAVWSPGGINLPIGNVKPFVLVEELQKLFDEETVLKSDGNGVLYLDYPGSCDFNIPEIATSLNEDDLKQGIPTISLFELIPSGSTKITGTMPISPLATFPYDLPEPDIDAGSEWDFIVDSVGFTNCSVNAHFTLGFNVVDYGTKTKLKVVFIFPDEFVLTGGKTVTKEVELVNNQYEYTVSSLAALSGFNSANTTVNVTYSIDLIPGSDTYSSRKGNEPPHFDLELFVTNPEITTVKARLSVSEYDVANDKISLRDLSEVFEGEGKITPANPSLGVTINTSLNVGLEVVMSKVEALKNGTPIQTITNTRAMSISKDATQYLYAAEYDGSVKENFFIPLDISSLINKKPDYIGYVFKTKPISGKTVYVQPSDIQVNADYLFKIPFSFKELNLSLDPFILEDVFTDDLAKNIFKENSGSVTICADSMLIDIGDNSSGLVIEFNIAYLDKDKNVIKDKTQTISSGESKLEITEDNLASLQNARHIQFGVKIVKDDNGHPLTFTDKDKIVIRKLKIKKSDGLPFEFEF